MAAEDVATRISHIGQVVVTCGGKNLTRQASQDILLAMTPAHKDVDGAPSADQAHHALTFHGRGKKGKASLSSMMPDHQELIVRFPSPDQHAHAFACIMRAARGLTADLPRTPAIEPSCHHSPSTGAGTSGGASGGHAHEHERRRTTTFRPSRHSLRWRKVHGASILGVLQRSSGMRGSVTKGASVGQGNNNLQGGATGPELSRRTPPTAGRPEAQSVTALSRVPEGMDGVATASGAASGAASTEGVGDGVGGAGEGSAGRVEPSAPLRPLHTSADEVPRDEVQTVELAVMVGSWNMGNARPTAYRKALEDWLPLRTAPFPGHPHGKHIDMVVLGVQEAEFNANVRYADCEAEWRAMVREHLGVHYIEVAEQSLWEIRIFVAVRAKEAAFVSNVHVCISHTGRIAGHGVLGNKGAITISFEYMSTRMAFTTAHFAAHQRRVKPRNDTFQEICAETVLPSVRAPELGDFTVAHDVCFFCGDLNYRLELRRDVVISLVDAWHEARLLQTSDLREASQFTDSTTTATASRTSKAARMLIGSNATGGAGEGVDAARPFAKLWDNDQLHQEMRSLRVFTDWSEVATPNFPPSYKYEKRVGPPKQPWRAYAEEKKRVPSWTDRILMRINRSDISAVTLEYTDVVTSNVLTSDHAPVRSHILLKVPLPALDVSLGLATPLNAKLGTRAGGGGSGGGFGGGFGERSSTRSSQGVAAADRLRRGSFASGGRSPAGGGLLPTGGGLLTVAPQPRAGVQPLGIQINQLTIHLSPGAIASRRLGKEEKHVKEQRKQMRARNESVVRVSELVAPDFGPSAAAGGGSGGPGAHGAVRFLGMRASVVASGVGAGGPMPPLRPNSRARLSSHALNLSGASSRKSSGRAMAGGGVAAGGDVGPNSSTEAGLPEALLGVGAPRQGSAASLAPLVEGSEGREWSSGKPGAAEGTPASEDLEAGRRGAAREAGEVGGEAGGGSSSPAAAAVTGESLRTPGGGRSPGSPSTAGWPTADSVASRETATTASGPPTGPRAGCFASLVRAQSSNDSSLAYGSSFGSSPALGARAASFHSRDSLPGRMVTGGRRPGCDGSLARRSPPRPRSGRSGTA